MAYDMFPHDFYLLDNRWIMTMQTVEATGRARQAATCSSLRLDNKSSGY
jgi:hypothetical protein